MSMTGIKIALLGSYLSAGVSTAGIVAGDALREAGATGRMLAQQDSATLLGIALVVSLIVGGYLTYFALNKMLTVLDKVIAVSDVQIETAHATQQLLVEVKDAAKAMTSQMGACEKIHTFLINRAGNTP